MRNINSLFGMSKSSSTESQTGKKVTIAAKFPSSSFFSMMADGLKGSLADINTKNSEDGLMLQMTIASGQINCDKLNFGVEVIQATEKESRSTRVFTFGLGSGADEKLVRGLISFLTNITLNFLIRISKSRKRTM